MPFAYANSNHNVEPSASEAAQPAASAPVTDTPAVQPELRAFSYSNTQHANDAPRDAVAVEVPEETRARREADADRKMFSPTKDHLDAGKELDQAFAEVPAEVRAAVVGEMKEIFADHGLSANESRDVVSLARQIGANPPDEATEQQWQRDAWEDLVRARGEKGATEALDLARQLVARDPRTTKLLDTTRLGNHPRFVKLMVEKARSARARGRL